MSEQTTQNILEEANELVNGARQASYGHPLDDFQRTAGMLSAMLAHKLKEPITAEEIGLIMCCVKISRQINRAKRDNLVDLAGYACTVSMVLDEKFKRGMK
jgi:hypothetical protein